MKAKIALSNLVVFALLFVFGRPAGASNAWFVDGVNGNDQNDCKTRQTACKTIKHGISLASSGDGIVVAGATYFESGLSLSVNLTIFGSGASTTIIGGGNADRVMTVSGAHVVLIGLTIRNGVPPCRMFQPSSGGGIYNNGGLTINSVTVTNNQADLGGGIYNAGTLAINNSTITGNQSCKIVYNFGLGGGVYNTGTLTINNSTVSQNHATGHESAGHGGGIYNLGTLAINSSTINGNSGHEFAAFGASGGGIANYATLIVNNSTITGNIADQGAGIFGPASLNNSTVSNNTVFVQRFGNVGGLQGAATVKNSIISHNFPGNCDNAVTSGGYNLSSDNTCNFHQAGDLNNIDPLLGTLQLNGGPTQTQALLDGSPAIDAGNPAGCTDGNGHLLATDQRGMPRPDHEDASGCDMGAYERQTD
jgi:hypothetical protein